MFKKISSFFSNGIVAPITAFFDAYSTKFIIGIIIILLATIAGLSISVYAYKKSVELKKQEISKLEGEKKELSQQISNLKTFNEVLSKSVNAKNVELNEAKKSEERFKLIMKDYDERLKKYEALASKIENEKDPKKKAELARGYYNKLFGGSALVRILR